ncbi:hypothetical protein [Streptomyces sp. NPDC004546]|uniref:hypothetical protein n=1 Tax=Streptomyces sp. NPDC004546 TaxID=3154282 RepID=UPI0033BEC54D
MTTAVFADQRQLGQRPHRSVTAQDSISQLEQRIRTSGEAGVELAPEAWQLLHSVSSCVAMQQTHPHGLRSEDVCSLVGAHGQAKAAFTYGGYQTE